EPLKEEFYREDYLILVPLRMSQNRKKRGYLASIVGCYCPRCREGKMFQHSTAIRLEKNLKMNKLCPVCSQPTEIEPGFYYGTAYVSYALTVAISVATFVAWLVLIGMSFRDNRFIGWLILNGTV